MRKMSIFIILAALLSSCTYAFNDKIRDEADDIPFISVQTNINRNVGSVFIWGGVIINSISADSGTYIEIAQTPLTKHGKIINSQFTQGRFIAYKPSSLAPKMLTEDELVRGKSLSVAGVLIKSFESTVEGRAYDIPLLEAMDIRLWDEIAEDVPVSSLTSDLSGLSP